MSVPVNLYLDRMSPMQPVRVADVYAVTQDRASVYTEAAAKIGLTTREYAEFRQALTDGGAIYVRLPRHIDAMAGVHRRTGRVYALRNVVVPSATMGWQIHLTNGTTVLIPQVCGNLSMNRSRAIAHPPRVVAARKQPNAVRVATHVIATPVVVAATPVTFEVPELGVAPATPPAAATGVEQRSGLPFLGLLFPITASLHGGTAPITLPASTLEIPPCSAGSNAIGVCRQ